MKNCPVHYILITKKSIMFMIPPTNIIQRMRTVIVNLENNDDLEPEASIKVFDSVL